MSSTRRSVITGIGAVTPLSSNAEGTWKKIIANQSGLGIITIFDPTESPCKIAGEVKYGDGEDLFNPDKYIDQKEQRKMDRFIHFAVAAADQAIADSGYVATTDEQRYRTGIMMGSGIGGLPAIEKTVITMKEKGIKKISPFFIPQSLINLASGQISIRHGFMGPNHAVVTACASGAHAIGDSARMIQYGDVDVMIAGGAESAICESGIGGFAALRALSTNFNEEPTRGSRPWDKSRDGFVMGEGAGVVILESAEFAAARGATIYGIYGGSGLTSDGHHIAQPDPEGSGAARAILLAVEEAGLTPADIIHINAHATSTPQGDIAEAVAIRKALGSATDSAVVTGTKSMTGHLLGGAGAVESIFTILALRDRLVPPTANLHTKDPEIDLDVAAGEPRALPAGDIAAVNNSFGFGGHDVAVVFRSA
jgi:3-oxoacyl-[acyl-carrier-protein] synthase II